MTGRFLCNTHNDWLISAIPDFMFIHSKNLAKKVESLERELGAASGRLNAAGGVGLTIGTDPDAA